MASKKLRTFGNKIHAIARAKIRASGRGSGGRQKYSRKVRQKFCWVEKLEIGSRPLKNNVSRKISAAGEEERGGFGKHLRRNLGRN